MKVFVDTNIILDVLQERTEFLQDSLTVIQMGGDKCIDLFASPLTFATCHYILRKEFDKKPDFEDMLQYESATANNCDVIVTRNGKHFPKGITPILTPKEFLARYT